MTKTKHGTGIQWTHGDGFKGETWNPVIGCTRVSEGCRNCYAELLAAGRLAHTERYKGIATMTPSGPRWTGEVRVIDSVMDQPLRWRKPRMIFVNSMSDLFHESVSDETLDRIFAVMALAPQHIFQVLTKRPERMREYMTHEHRNPIINVTAIQIAKDSGVYDRLASDEDLCPWLDVHAPWIMAWPQPHMWLGLSVENQQVADERIPLLLQTPAAVRFLSCEPLLGAVDLQQIPYDDEDGHVLFFPLAGELTFEGCNEPLPLKDGGIHWVIAGSESGPNRRPCDLDWARSIRDQCGAAAVPFFLKQLHIDGSKIGTPKLDGRSWTEFPEVRR